MSWDNAQNSPRSIFTLVHENEETKGLTMAKEKLKLSSKWIPEKKHYRMTLNGEYFGIAFINVTGKFVFIGTFDGVPVEIFEKLQQLVSKLEKK